MNQQLKLKTQESLSAVLPITGIVLALSIFLVPLEIGTMVMFFVGAVMLIIGMGMFQLGAEMAMSPLGEGIGVQVTKAKKVWIMAGVSLLMGILITIAEPDLQVLSNQVPSIPNNTLIFTVAIGVGVFLSLAALRIVLKIDLSVLLIILYIGLLAFSFFVPREFLAVAFDSGGVTTGPITVPFIMALGVGLSSIRSDKNASSDSFGLVAMSSIGPILAVMLLGFFYRTTQAVYSETAVVSVNTMRDVAAAFALELPHYAKEVAISILPIVAVYVIFQLLTHRYQGRQRARIVVGFGYTYLGLVLFLCGVNVGFAPVGTMLGRELTAGTQSWLLVPIGMLIGYFIVKAEPAIQILNRQVQSVSNGLISAKSMNRALSIGVAASIGLAVLRILTGTPIQWIIIPGYIIALIMSRMVPKIFVGIAFDSGGVASGPMTSTFLLPLCIGACEAIGANIMTDAFGVVALVALTPLIAIQIMGVNYQFKLNKQEKTAKPESLIPKDSDMIIEIEEE
ncbi:MAG: DUF1538 domain-containing protein [Lachnospiraceae bacterium]|nr:DUF1538 domain-containing protein [Lachnospiraceae bacterium]MDD7026934.1 DUF1538 domain-containing protein [Lachnospiraceae bacterium]MDY5700746.1 DUF1538 domain-containing protein [Lachnospiraceae bacterium]